MTTVKYAQRIALELDIDESQAAAAIDLLDAGNTLPFIARYRKEATRGLDEDQLRRLGESLTRRRALDERREVVLASIEDQGKLTDDLRALIEAAETQTALEDLYQPYKPKRRTRAMIARERGLEPLAEMILTQRRIQEPLEQIARPYLSDQVPTVEDVWAGARDIVAEVISDHAAVRGQLREKALRWGLLRARKIDDAQDDRRVYQLYYEYEAPLPRLKPYQVLAINRGEAEKVLRVHVDVAERDWRGAIETHFRPDRRSLLADQLERALVDAAERLLLPAIERDARRTLTEAAETHAIQVFANNLRGLLNQPPLAGRSVLGIDPGFRTGCKVAVVDPTGKVLATTTIFPHEPQRRWQDALAALDRLVATHGVSLITIGNGTASRETEQLVAELTRGRTSVNYLIVNEAGASVYSASPLARAELPDLDVSMRGAVSIARRAQDPLAELVKIDPKSIGVGLYQHDVDQKQLAGALDGVVESVVNRVGVDVNTASPALLTYVAGVGAKLAQNIVAHREAHGAFASRASFRDVSGLGAKAFEQAAGFLRVRDGENPLDMTAIHPESYAVAQAVLNQAGFAPDAPQETRETAIASLIQRQPVEALAAQLGAGAPTLQDILEQLVRPGRDPREDLPLPILRSDVLSMDDLQEGMRLNGTVRNVVDFGAFVDIGVKQDGLLHRSQIPFGVQLTVGEIVEVVILNVDLERGRIQLGWGKET
ncbi:MAG: RNA-binding transcriptional accessory protein [Anaerolineae bacterium]|nr:RNA-binding transcriptional accessory protein [Anaerolineae bacterium]